MYAAGLSSIRFRAILLATALGMMPGTFAFVYLGGSEPGPRTWAVLLGLAVLAAGAYVFHRRFSSGPVPASVSGLRWKPGGWAHIMCCS